MEKCVLTLLSAMSCCLIERTVTMGNQEGRNNNDEQNDSSEHYFNIAKVLVR